VQFGVECDPMQYENKVGITKGIHLLNFQVENSSERFKNHLRFRINFTLSELVSIVKVFKLFKLAWIFSMFEMWT